MKFKDFFPGLNPDGTLNTALCNAVNNLSVQDVYDKIANKFGIKHQMVKAVEEMSELTKELCKLLDNDKLNRDNMIEEIADVEIMLEQLKQYFQIKNFVQEIKGFKLERLKKISE